MTRYVDLHVVPHVDSDNVCIYTAETLRIAGYSVVGLAMPTGLMPDRIRSIHRLFHERGLETTSRVDLTASSRMELLRLLRRFRNSCDIIGVKCLNQAAATIACRDRRVDLVFFDPGNRRIRFNHSLANLLHGAVEFNLSQLLVSDISSDVLSRFAKEMGIAHVHDTRVVLSSGSASSENVRSPLQMAAIASALGLSKEQSLLAVSKTPLSIIARNIEKRSSSYIEEGVKVLLPKAR
jgi:RNase P/RNase MRP subunit p30